MNEQRYWTLLAKKLSGELTPEEEAEWTQLRRSFPHLRFASESLDHLWEGDKPQPSAEALAAWERQQQKLAQVDPAPAPQPEIVPVPERSRSRRYWLALPVLALLLGTAWLLRPASAPDAPATGRHSEVSTRPGSRSRVLLPDSTVVWLNAGSRLTYGEGFGVVHRRIELTGEAYFDVTHNAALPFVVQTHDVRIRVLGTAFNVKAYPGEATETSLLRGQVQLTLEKRPGETYRLRPHEKLTVSDPADTAAGRPLVVLRNLEPTRATAVVETAWIDNKLVFRNETLGQLAVRMTRWYGIPVSVPDATLAEERVSGAFVNETLPQALAELQLIARFRLQENNGTYLLTPNN